MNAAESLEKRNVKFPLSKSQILLLSKYINVNYQQTRYNETMEILSLTSVIYGFI